MLRNAFGFSSLEKRVVAVLAATYMARMLGLFMVLPVLALAAERFAGATPLLVGLALGIHGLPQALLQIPLGLLSDRVGRKPVIIAGFLIFVSGSLVAAAADTMVVLIVGRVLQGMGAVAAVMMALAADLIREERRSGAFAFIGLGIGLAFILALIAGPVVDAQFGLRGIFLTGAALGVVAIALIAGVLPSPEDRLGAPAENRTARAKVGSKIIDSLRDSNLWRLDASVFFLHLVLTANFFLLPTLLKERLEIPQATHWMFYAPILIGSFILILPLLRVAEKRRWVKEFLLTAVILIGITQIAAFFLDAAWLSVVGVTTLFFFAFNYLEATLPALVSRFCAADTRGISMGMFSNGQFLGIFAGGLLAGSVSSVWGDDGIYLMNSVMVFVWVLVLAGMGRPCYTNGK